ncbi:unnamed protein product [Urochloa decumbens]|uniref:Uncharacterized protein n=1 Tax=Urochloa decumbens TaxID=240449 RepID=A0ABC9E8H5_9POAL
MDKEIFANDGSSMERFKQMQHEMQEKEKAAAAADSAAPKPANPKQGFAVAANKRPFELKKAGPVGTGGKLAFSLKKAKKSVQANAPVAAAPAGAAGEGLGSERRGRADPIMAGDVKKDNLGVGAVKPGEVTSEDDIYEQ